MRKNIQKLKKNMKTGGIEVMKPIVRNENR